MKNILPLFAGALVLSLSGCCFLGIGAGSAASPAPAPAPVAAAPAPAPAPRPAPVAAPIAPADNDRDGVVDEKDRCPTSPAGSEVNDFGCPKGEKVSIALNVQFDTGKAVVKADYDDQLRKVADFLKSYPASSAEIEGHTDSMGSAASNTALSQRRADAVRQALVDRFGADAGRLSAKGYGPDKPVADNASAEGRAQNRRVIATFTATKS